MKNQTSNPVVAIAVLVAGLASVIALLSLVGLLGLSCKFLVWAWTW